jgi:hypothetical protein
MKQKATAKNNRFLFVLRFLYRIKTTSFPPPFAFLSPLCPSTLLGKSPEFHFILPGLQLTNNNQAPGFFFFFFFFLYSVIQPIQSLVTTGKRKHGRGKELKRHERKNNKNNNRKARAKQKRAATNCRCWKIPWIHILSRSS